MKNLKFITLLLFIFLVLGCGKLEDPKPLPLNEAHTKFVELCKEDFLVDVKIKAFDRTLWIFVPFREGFIHLKADNNGAFVTKENEPITNIQYLEGSFKNETFNIEYDFAQSRKYKKSMGTTYNYSQKFKKANQNILSALNRVYSQVTPSPEEDGALIDRDQPINEPPLFVVTVFADITHGIQISTLVHFKDVQRAMIEHSFGEEYVRRSVTYQPEGNQELVGDEEGSSLDYKDYTWGEFLTEQIIYRVQFKYQRSAFPPSEDSKNEILNIVATVTNAYAFGDYNNVVLNNLTTEETTTVEKPQILDLIKSKENTPDRLHTIKFDGFGKIDSSEGIIGVK